MANREIAAFLTGIELFVDLTDKELLEIAEPMRVLEYRSGDYLFKQHESRENLFVIAEGRAELFKTTVYGEEKRIAFFGPRDFLSEGALLEDYPHSTSARAVESVTAYALDRAGFREFSEKNPSFSAKILSRIARVISRRMRQTTNQVVNAAAQYLSGQVRVEHDLLGDREVPQEFCYGVQTLRAIENFNISGIAINKFPDLIVSLAQVKMACAKANKKLGLLDGKIADAIIQACEDVAEGKMHTHFAVDMIQGGAGTSTNMNANEVIANRALKILGKERGQYEFCQPNNHVNMSQSTNDVYPTALKVAFCYSNDKLIEELSELVSSFRRKGLEFANIIKTGRTQLQDAVPMTLGQEFEAYAVTLEEEIERLEENAKLFWEINLGGTAIGTGLNAHPEYPNLAVGYLSEITGLKLRLAKNLVEDTSDSGAFVMYSSAVKRLSVKLSKICNDLRLMSSGPRAGFNEINLPKMQPGSSIMPGKVNPVIPEVVNQIAFKVIGNDLTVTLAAEAGQLELNVMEPIIAQSIFESIEMLKNGMATLRIRCVDGIQANAERCLQMTLNSIGLVTALNPLLGYQTCSAIAKEALETDRSVYDLILEKKLLTKETLDQALDPKNMIGFMKK